jgi:uncharacterized membrane protein YeaQ/YmgE (transglycosylase-associated protein family)
MEELLLWEFTPKVREWATLLFFWSGVAIWTGLAARFLIPARVVRGPWLTLCLGFVGSCLGPFALRSFFNVDRFDPIGPCGLLASVCAAAATLCLFYAVSFFFPSRFDDEEDENDDESAENEKREKVGEEARRREPRDVPRRREYERADSRDWERDERSERERREYEYAEDELAEARDERERDRRSRPRRR